MDLDKAFRGVVGNPNRTFHVYSDVCASTMVGNKVKDLLREIRYKREGGGLVYFEPLHIQYILIRNDIVETIETEVAESETGHLVNFGKGKRSQLERWQLEPFHVQTQETRWWQSQGNATRSLERRYARWIDWIEM